jgi:hypothetical protein
MNNRQKLIFVLLLVLILSAFYERGTFDRYFDKGAGSTSTLDYVFRNQISDRQVEGAGIVERILADDTSGSRHQRIILRTGKNQTVLIAHNIDLAPRVEGIKRGERLAFFGEYEWNNKGGVVHWTHRDPSGRHIDGWLKYHGRIYQ